MMATTPFIFVLFLTAVALDSASADLVIQPRPGGPAIQPRQSSCSNIPFAFTATGQSAVLNSPNYPSNYPSGSDCSWLISSPAGTAISIQCSDFVVPCSSDYMFFSLSGDPNFSDAQVGYCGSGSSAPQTSSGNQLNIGFHAGSGASGTRRYSCTLSVVGKAAPAPTTSAPSTTATTAVSAPTTQNPGSASCSCGVKFPTTRIVGGTAAAAGEFPWRTLVFPYDPSTGSGGVCGGTIISPNWVLTAAHCTMDMKTGNKINVYWNTTQNAVTTGAKSQMAVADRYVQHPLYSRTTLDNDLTLIHLPTPIAYGLNVGPICLPFLLSTNTFQGSNVTASGWGTTAVVPAGSSNNGSPSNTLQKVVLPVLTTAQCQAYYGSQITQNMLCTYKPGQDTCQGDSGGSIDYQSTNGLWYDVGVTSFGIGCATKEYPGVYAKVQNYLTWIEQTTGETFCKK